jgi:riboflavin kinase/FMN adenylyltransferase
MVIGATGFFDGVHLGHRAVLDKLKESAQISGKRSVVFTLWPHPRTVLQQDAARFRLLNSLEEKRELILNAGIDEMQVLRFDKEFASQTTKEFLKNYLIDKYGVSSLVLGYDHRLGKDQGQTQEEIIKIANDLGLETILVDRYDKSEITVSSTKIREALLAGAIEKANSMLGYGYSLSGVVVEGQRLGRTLGFPTANMKMYEPLKVLPADGVYIVDVFCLGGNYKGITNIGRRPTVGSDNERTIETWILDFDEDIYGLDIKISFSSKLRDEIAFASLDELIEQMNADKKFLLSL